MIVLNENAWAAEAIESHNLGKAPFETLRRVARYYMDEFGYKKYRTRKEVTAFLLSCEPTASVPKWADTIEKAIDTAQKHAAINIDHIDVTRAEMDKIDALDGVQLQKLAFTLLCLAKYSLAVNPASDGWVWVPVPDIMSMANITSGVRRQSFLFGVLREFGLLQFAKAVDNTNVKVLFLEDGPTVLSVTDLRNLGYQYLMYHDSPLYFKCEHCGMAVKYNEPETGRKQKYCKECAIRIHMKQMINAVMLKRMSPRGPSAEAAQS